ELGGRAGALRARAEAGPQPGRGRRQPATGPLRALGRFASLRPWHRPRNLESSGAMSREDEIRAVDTVIRMESNEAMRRGTIYAAIFGFASGLLLFLLMRLGAVRDLVIPAVGAIAAGSYCVLL